MTVIAVRPVLAVLATLSVLAALAALALLVGVCVARCLRRLRRLCVRRLQRCFSLLQWNVLRRFPTFRIVVRLEGV